MCGQLWLHPAAAPCCLEMHTLFAQTKVDVTSWGSMLFVPGMVLLALVFIGVFWINKITFLVIAGAAALLASVYIVYDLQLM